MTSLTSGSGPGSPSGTCSLWPPAAAAATSTLAPKGRADTLATLDERTVAYLDLTGSGAETIAHPRDNGRITPHVLRLVRAAADPAPPRAGTDRPARRAAMGRRRPAAGADAAVPVPWWSSTSSASPTPAGMWSRGTGTPGSASCSSSGPNAGTTPPSPPTAPSTTTPASTTSPPSQSPPATCSGFGLRHGTWRSLLDRRSIAAGRHRGWPRLRLES